MTVSEMLRSAYAAYAKGDMNAARTRGEAALRFQPDNAAVLQLLGVIGCRTGDPRRGADYLRAAIRNGGDTPDNRINLSKALLDLGDYDEALLVCAPGGIAANPDLQRMQAEILKAQGRPSEVTWLLEQVVGERPDDVEAWNNLGNSRHDLGDLEGALQAFRHAQSLDPGAALVYGNMGRVLVSMDRYEEACLMLEKSALLAPKDPAPLLELGRALTGINHPAAALKALGAAARLDPRDPRIFVAIGTAFTDLSDMAQAERAFRFAIQADVKSAAAHLNLGILLEKANRVDELETLIAQAVAAGIDGDEIVYLRALLSNRRGDPAVALDLARSVMPGSVHSAALSQFVGQLADRLGELDQAFMAFEDMNRATAASPLALGIDRGAYRRAIDGLRDQTTPEWYARWTPVPPPSGRPSPAFLVGFPRSGTTLLDTILMGHSRIHVLEEIPLLETVSTAAGPMARLADMGAAEIADLRALYFAELEKASPPPAGKLVLDKNPLSMIRLPLIHRLFPDARIVLAMRHPCDVVLSCYMQNFKPTEAMASFLDLTHASHAYAGIFAYWEQCRTVIPGPLHMLRYEAMVADVEAAVRPLVDFLGLDWEAQLLDHQDTARRRGFIRTPSYAQVTERVYSTASGRWTRYRDQMRDALPILKPWVERYGYALD